MAKIKMTYDQAVSTYKKRVKELDAGYKTLVRNLNSFLKNTRKSLEKMEKGKEEILLKNLEQQMN